MQNCKVKACMLWFFSIITSSKQEYWESDFIELGLSFDTYMHSHLPDLHISRSRAQSVSAKIKIVNTLSDL